MRKPNLLDFALFAAIGATLIFVVPAIAATLNMSVTVGNSAPAFTVAPAESPASDGTTPINEDTKMTINATATDVNNDDYYLLVCKTNGAPTPGSDAAPECNGGSGNNLCVSSQTNSGTEASDCQIDPLILGSESVTWYAFVCDYSTQSACSAAATGSGTSGSPIKINHAPTFTTAPSKPSMNVGGSVTYTVLAANWGDTDTDTSADTGKLLVCATEGLTNGACTGTQLCASSAMDPGNNLSCTFNDSASTVKAAGSYNAYVYVVDNHTMEATGAAEGTNVGYTVNNSSPVVSDISLNGGSNISLNEGTTKNITVSATITDANGCQDLAATPVAGNAYRSPTYTNLTCTTNSEHCYILTGCVVDAGNICDGSADSSVKYNCTATMQYYSDPTDGTSASNPYYADTWKATITATDKSAATNNLTTGTGVELNSMNAATMNSSIDFGALAPKLASNSGIISAPVTITNVGNIGLNVELKGDGSGLCTDYPTCSGGVIPLAQQKWEYQNNTTAYTAGTNALTSSYVDVPLGVHKPTASATSPNGSIYWGILIPEGQAYGSYTGSNTINTFVSDPVNW